MSCRPASSTELNRDHIRTFGQVLAKTEKLTPEELQSYQGPLISRLLLHARKTTKFYRDRIDRNFTSTENIRNCWPHIPIVTRTEVVKNRLKLMSRRPPPIAGAVIEGMTSGSTGAPLAFRKSGLSEVASIALTERLYRWWGLNGENALALIGPAKAGVKAGADGYTTHGWHSSHPTGLRHLIAPSAGIEMIITWLLKHRPNYLGAYPPVLRELAQSVRGQGIDLKLSLILSFATVLDEETRELCRVVFGAEIADTYGAEEVGHIAAQCRDCGEYHVSAEATLVEVDSSGLPVAPGQIGRVVVTPLYNYAMPLIRYELGDMAEVGATPVTCGRGLPTLRRILGRYRNLFRYRDGSASWPAASKFRLTDFIALKHFQVVQTDLDRVEIRYIPQDEHSEQRIDHRGLTEHVRSVLRQPVEVTVQRVAQIQRSRSGKYEDCISLVPTVNATTAMD